MCGNMELLTNTEDRMNVIGCIMLENDFKAHIHFVNNDL
jgi:hypothetical protein